MLSKIKHITGNAYFRALRPYYFTGYPFRKYFLLWNRGDIKGRDIDEKKIFHNSDTYYIKKTTYIKTEEIIDVSYYLNEPSISKTSNIYGG